MGVILTKPEDPLKDKYYDKYVRDMASQSGKVFAITGTTSGTGFYAARALASKGGSVLCLNRPSERTSRSLAELKAFCADGGSVEQVDCDLQDFASVKAAAAVVSKKTASSGLFALVNNAGVMALANKTTKDGFDIQMQTNHLSHFLLSAKLMTQLEKATGSHGEARIVNHSSVARNDPFSALEGKYMHKIADGVDLGDDGTNGRRKRYQQTKLANAVFTLATKDRLDSKGSKVKSLVAHPGVATTQLTHNITKTSPGSIFDNKRLFAPLKFLLQGPGDGALPLLEAITSSEANSGDFYGPGNRGPTSRLMTKDDGISGPPIKLVWADRPEVEKYSLDPLGQKLLWECSEAATGVKFLSQV